MTDDNLTRAEAAERARTVSNASYEVALDLTQGDATFRSETTVRYFTPLTGMDTFLDLDAPAVHEITLNGRSIDPAAFDRGRSRIPLRGSLPSNEVRVVADCAYQHTGVGLHKMVDPTDGQTYLHTQFEPYDAHRVFACFDQPDIKGQFTLEVVAPASWTVVSNMPVASHTPDGQRATWRFQPTPALSTYLVAVVAGPYEVVRERHGRVELGLYCRASLRQYLDPDELFELTRQGLDFFEAEYAYPYPFAKYDQLFVPEFNFGAMENPGCVTFNESMVFRSRVTEATREGRANTLLHEMAHMWFGDLVTMRWWDDLWLNESFATYMASHALSRATRFANSWVRFALGTKAGAASQDQLPTTHPISADIVDTDSVRQHFDGITYSKGASVLRQLVAWVGEEQFREALRAYFPRYEWSNATLTDLLRSLEAASGRDLGAWSKEWLERAGVNVLRADLELDGEGRYRRVGIHQGAAMDDHPTLRSHRVGVGLYDLDGSDLVLRRRVELDVVGPETLVPDLAGEVQPDLLLVNDGDLTYAKVRLDERSLATLGRHLGGLADPLARALCWASAWDMVRDGELATRRFVAMVAAHAGEEPDDAILGGLLGQSTVALDAYGDPANRGDARNLLAAAARAELHRAAGGSDRQLIWARQLVNLADEPADQVWARGLLDGSVEVPGLAVDTDFRWHVVGALAAYGAEGADELIVAEERRDPTDFGARRAAAARAARPTQEAKAGAWDAATSGHLPLATIRAVCGGFAQWGQDDLLRTFVPDYADALRGWWFERTREEALALANGLFPGRVVEPATVGAVDDLLADGSLPGPLRRVLLEGKDRIERALRARAADVA